MPSRFDVVGGLVIGAGGTLSRQCDLLVIDAINCPRLLQTGGAGLYPVDGVVGLIEVTQHLKSDKRKDDLAKVAQLRALPTSFPYPADFRDRAPLAFIFAEMAESSLAANGRALADEWRRTADEAKGCLPNGIVILDAGIVLYQDEKGSIHCDPYNAVNVVCLAGPEVGLLVWLLLLLDRFKILIEQRIRARAFQILSIRTGKSPGPDLTPLLHAAGAEPYFPSLSEYFSVNDWEVLQRVTGGNLETIPLRD